MIVTKVNCDGYLAQLSEEVIGSYDTEATKAVTDIVDDLLAFQRKTVKITKGTIAPTVSRALKVENTTILHALLQLRESVGGYISVDNDRVLQWATDIGENKGQQIRYRKNLQGIVRETRYGELCTRLFPLGGSGIKLSDIGIENEVATKDSDASYGYLTLSAKYACYKGWTGLGNALPDKVVVSGGEVWVVPTGHSADEDWDYPTLAYDDDVASGTDYGIIFNGWTTPFELTLPETTSAKLKCYLYKRQAPETISKVKVEIYHTGAYHTVYEADFPIEEWFEIEYDEEDVSKVRLSFFNTETYRAYPHIYEVHVFGNTTDPVWHQGVDEHALRCAKVDYDGEADYRVSYTHADFLMAWAKIAAGDDIISRILTNKFEAYPITLLEAGRLMLDELKEVPVSYSISTADLSESEEFNFDFDALQLGSIVTIIDEELGISVAARVVKIVHPDLLKPQDMKVEITTRLRDIADVIVNLYRELG